MPSNVVVKRVIVLILFGAVLLILGFRFFLPLRYAFMMPRVPEPGSGRIYRVMVGSGIHVYLNKGQVDLLDLLDYKLSAVAVCCMFLLLYLKLRAKWF